MKTATMDVIYTRQETDSDPLYCSWWTRVMIYLWRVKCFTNRRGKRILAAILCEEKGTLFFLCAL